MASTKQTLEALYKETLDSLNDGVAIYDADKRLVYSNERYRSMNPNSADVIVPGTLYYDILRHGAERGEYPDAVGRIDDFLADITQGLFRNGEPYDLKRQNGSWYRVVNKQLSAGGFVASRVDITDLKLAEIDAKHHEQEQHQLRIRFQHILDAITTQIVVFDTREQCHFINSSAATEMGLNTEQAMKLSIQEMYGDVTRAKIKRDIAKAARRAVPQSSVFPKASRFYRETLSLHQFSNDSLTVIETSDITNLRHAEDEIRNLQTQLTDALDCMAEGFCLFNKENKLLLINRAMSATMGCDPSIWWVGQSLEELFRAYYSSFTPQLAPDVMEKKTLHSLARAQRADGTPEEMLLPNGQWVMAKDYRSRSGCLVCVRTNITTLMNANAVLSKAQIAAEDANRMKSVFLTTMSHELRTPLHGILGNIELLDRGHLPPAQKKRIFMLRSAAEGLLHLLNDILDLSKIEAGSLDIFQESFRLNETVERCAQTFAPTILGKKIRFHCFIDTRLKAPRLGDSHRISQVVMNLLSNASKFTESGSITLSAALQKGKGKDHIRITVVDSGIGIGQQHQETIFSPFSQVDSSISRRFGGTGIGLSLCERFAKLMNGKIKVESELNVGSIFTLDLKLPICGKEVPQSIRDALFETIFLRCKSPQWSSLLAAQLKGWMPTCNIASDDGISACDRPGILILAEDVLPPSLPQRNSVTIIDVIVISPDGPLVPERRKKSIYVTSLSSSALRVALTMCGRYTEKETTKTQVPAVKQDKKILIAEDDSINRILLTHQLETLGYDNITSVRNGEQALQQLMLNTYDLIISDIGMPNIDGAQLLMQMRNRGILTPTIIQTAGTAKEIPNIVNAQARGILFKPVGLEQLQAALDDALKTHHGTPPQTKEKRKLVLEKEMRSTFLLCWSEDKLLLERLLKEANVNAGMDELHRLRGALLAINEETAATDCETLRRSLGKHGFDPAEPDFLRFWSTMDAVVQRVRAYLDHLTVPT